VGEQGGSRTFSYLSASFQKRGKKKEKREESDRGKKKKKRRKWRDFFVHFRLKERGSWAPEPACFH